MAKKTITSANAVLTLSVDGLIPAPVQIQGFAADDIFDIEALERAEVLMGADGKLSAGKIYVAVPQSITLQADSDSNLVFDTIDAAEQADDGDKYFIDGHIILSSVGMAYTLQNGVLMRYQAIANAKKTLQPRTHTITWERIIPLPISAGGVTL